MLSRPTRVLKLRSLRPGWICRIVSTRARAGWPFACIAEDREVGHRLNKLDVLVDCGEALKYQSK